MVYLLTISSSHCIWEITEIHKFYIFYLSVCNLGINKGYWWAKFLPNRSNFWNWNNKIFSRKSDSTITNVHPLVCPSDTKTTPPLRIMPICHCWPSASNSLLAIVPCLSAIMPICHYTCQCPCPCPLTIMPISHPSSSLSASVIMHIIHHTPCPQSLSLLNRPWAWLWSLVSFI